MIAWLLVAAVACSFLGDDSSRVVLPRGGVVEITPSCVALPLPKAGVTLNPGSQDRAITLFAKDKGGAPAESLSVTVTLGPCSVAPATESTATSDTAAGGVAAGGNAGTGGTGGMGGSRQPPRGETFDGCGDGGVLKPTQWGVVSLAEQLNDPTCKLDGAQRISCRLGPRGTAGFVVRGLSTDPALTEHYVPFCVRAPTAGGDFHREIHAVFSPDAPVDADRILIERVRSATLAGGNCKGLSCLRGPAYRLQLLRGGVVPVPSEDGASGAPASMGGANGSGAGGVPSSSAPQDAAGGAPEQPTPVTPSATPLIAHVSVTSSNAWISEGNTCTQASTNQILFDALSNTSRTFSVCSSDGAQSDIGIRAVLLDNLTISGSLDGVNIPPAIENVSSVVRNEQELLQVVLCGGEAMQTGFQASGLGVHEENGRFVLDPTAPPAASGAGGEAGASPVQQPNTEPIDVTLNATGQSCSFQP